MAAAVVARWRWEQVHRSEPTIRSTPRRLSSTTRQPRSTVDDHCIHDGMFLMPDDDHVDDRDSFIRIQFGGSGMLATSASSTCIHCYTQQPYTNGDFDQIKLPNQLKSKQN